mgnify:CR=1 FL=1
MWTPINTTSRISCEENVLLVLEKDEKSTTSDELWLKTMRD